MNSKTSELWGNIIGVTLIVVLIVGIVFGLFFGIPTYNVWRLGKNGEARLRQAEQEKQIMIETAKAELESAKLRAEAIEIMGEKAKQYPEYRLQEFMGAFAEALQNDSIQKIIYVPTEANIPLVEAGRTVDK